MKSSLELAMERLNKAAPAKKLTNPQKTELAEVESLYQAKIAEQEIRYKDKKAIAEASGDAKGARTLRDEFVSDKGRLERERDAKKARIRGE